MENKIKDTLLKKGVKIPNPESVFISDDVDPARISSDNVVLYAGTKLIGEKTLILKNTAIGYESPVTLEDTYVGEGCSLDGGFFKGAVFAGSNAFGSGAHVREGTIFEEGAKAAHTVGLKQTILFPYVTLGSLINFCDCFMAGGTGAKNHSEVGSSFIHFNFTPNQDKATASMMGDIPNGVMLKSSPVFLGGQGGLIGPVRIAYGCTTAAGCIIRKSETRQDRLIFGGRVKDISIAMQPRVYRTVLRIYNHNVDYIAALFALKAWYHHIRPLFGNDDMSFALINGLKTILDLCINERIKRFDDWCEKLKVSKNRVLKLSESSSLVASHDKVLDKKALCLETFDKLDIKNPDKEGEIFIRIMEQAAQNNNKDYLAAVLSLNSEASDSGIKWLSRIQDNIRSTLTIE